MKSRYLILEYNEFTGKIQQNLPATDRGLSLNTFDVFKNDVTQAMIRLNLLMSNALAGSKETNGYVTEQVPTDLKVLRIFKNDSFGLNLYFSFVINNIEYFGMIENINRPNTVFKTEAFRSPNLEQTREWQIRIKGIILKTIKEWFSPERGKYIALKDITCLSTTTGKELIIEKNRKVEVIGSSENTIYVLFNNIKAAITDEDYYYFNYYFNKID